jgi:hypothetical protein
MRKVRHPWALCAFTCLCIATYAGLYLASDLALLRLAGVLEDGFPFVPLSVVLGAVLGALILSRYPDNRVGWLLSIGQAGTGLGFATSAYAYRVLAEHALGPPVSGHLAAWVSHLFGAGYAVPLTCALFLLVPDGRLLSRRWRPVMAVVILSYALYAGALIAGVPPQGTVVSLNGTPIGPLTEAFIVVSQLLWILGVLGAAAALVLRLRRSTGVQRQQLRWIMASAVSLALGAVVLTTYQVTVEPGQPWYAMLLLYLGYASVPVCTGIAVLRYRLYDIDLIVSRAFVLAALATFVTVGYVTVVVVIGAALGTRVELQFWPSLAALVLVALAFQPLRQRVLRLADRLVYGQRAAPYEALAGFSRRLGRSAATSELLPALAAAVARSVGAEHSRVSLEVAGAADASVTWPDDADRVPDFEVEVRDGDESLGRIAVTMPPGRRLRRVERRLLDDFAAQAGLAFRNLRLDAELRAQVEQVGRQSAELADSRRRLLAARDDERRRTAGIIQREVLSHLRPIPPSVASLDVTDTAAAERTLRRLEVATGAGLDALREVTQGLFPIVLTRRGLVPALHAHCARVGRPGVLSAVPDLHSQRFDERTEAAAYFCSVAVLRETEANVPARLALTMESGCLVLDATGTSRRSERQADERAAIVDRVEAVGGQVSYARGPEEQLAVRAVFPVEPRSDTRAAALSVASGLSG